jgi:DNA adenine methylase
MPKARKLLFVVSRDKTAAVGGALRNDKKPANRSRRAHGVKPPFGYYGAKQRLASDILKMLPPHNAWVEAFCGSAAITLAKPPAPIEVINDLDGNIINLFRVLRRQPNALARAVALTPYARKEFNDAGRKRKKLTPVEKARRFLARTMMTVNGDAKDAGFSYSSSFARGGMEARVRRWNNVPDRLTSVAQRLTNVRIESLDARRLLELFLDRPATLMYLDPPYFVKRDHRYVIDANDEAFHRELLTLCRRARCMILLSGYDTPLYRKMLRPKDGWKSVSIKTHTRDTDGKDYVRREVLWQNKHFVKAARTGRVPIRLTPSEKRNDKINPPRGRKVNGHN